MPKFTKPAPAAVVEVSSVPAPVPAPGMVVIKLAVPAWDPEIVVAFRDAVQGWLNKVHTGEIGPGNTLTLEVPR